MTKFSSEQKRLVAIYILLREAGDLDESCSTTAILEREALTKCERAFETPEALDECLFMVADKVLKRGWYRGL